jgi:hypothetical protein
MPWRADPVKQAQPRARGRYSRTGKRRIPRNRPRPNYLLLFSVFVLSALSTTGIYYTLTTPKLDVRSIDIKGVHLADAKAIEQTASLAEGRNIILVRTSPIVRRVERLSEGRTVKIGRRFPNRMWLRVWERKPDAVLASGSGFYLVQADGFVFHRLVATPRGVPVIAIAGNERFVPGRNVRCASARYALEVLQIARAKAIRLGKISVDREGDMCLNMGSDFCVKLGQPDDMAAKMSVLQQALACRPSMVREGGYLNLTCPTNPARKPRMAAASAP